MSEPLLHSRVNEDPNPVLCAESRNGIVESIYRGVVCLVKLNGESHDVIHATGNIKQMFYPRSALKYCQVLPLLESGCVEEYKFTLEEISVMCASHDGEPRHLELVRSILAKIGLKETDLGCGGHLPDSEATIIEYIRCKECNSSRGIYNNCSGKHAGFLALAKYIGSPIETYLHKDHPVQKLVQAAACDVFGIDPLQLHIGIDGCSAPTFGMTVETGAVGYARLSNPDLVPHFSEQRKNAIKLMINAITTYPYAVWGSVGYDSLIMKAAKGNFIGKRGACGVHASGYVGKGLGSIVKIDSGSGGDVHFLVSMKLLRFIGIDYSLDDEKEKEILDQYVVRTNTDYNNNPVGTVECVKTVFN